MPHGSGAVPVKTLLLPAIVEEDLRGNLSQALHLPRAAPSIGIVYDSCSYSSRV